MEILDNRHNHSFAGQTDSLSNDGHRKQDFVERMINFFSLTKEERLKAGIFVGSEGREWMEDAALKLPPPGMYE